MSEPTPPDGHQPAEPPRIPEQSSGDHDVDADADDTPQRAERPVQRDDQSTVERPAVSPPAPVAPPADSTVAFVPGAAVPGPGTGPPAQQPPDPFPPTQPVPGTRPPAPPPPATSVPAAAAGAAAGYPPGQPPGPPGGPPYGGPAGPPGGPPFGGGPGEPTDDGKNKRTGLLVGGLVALVVLLVGALGFVVTQTGDDAEPVTTEEPDDTDPEDTRPEDTEPEPTDPVITEPVETSPPTAPPTTGSVDGVVVHIEARGDVVDEADLQATLEQIGLSEGDDLIATADPVLNLCAALPVPEPVTATVEWRLDNSTVSEGAARPFAVPADGNCINNGGAELDAGSYEVSFTDDAGGLSSVALFTVGAVVRSQDFLNDTGGDVCSVDAAPVTTGFYQPYELADGAPLLDGEIIIVDLADVEQEARAVACDGTEFDPVTFMPSDDPVSLTTGAVIPPTTVPPPQITDTEVAEIDGAIGSLDTPISPGSTEEAIVFDLLRTSTDPLPIATTEPTVTLCAAWNVPGPLDADVVWEFNRVEIARFPVTAVDGGVGNCIPPGGARFDEGAYQVYLQRGDFISAVETFTAGRAQTQLAFRNDTGVSICEVGFSPNLTNWYTFFEFAESADFESALEPGAAFTIVAPLIENDIQARDCDGNVVSENFDIPPTDQTLDLSTGRP